MSSNSQINKSVWFLSDDNYKRLREMKIEYIFNITDNILRE